MTNHKPPPLACAVDPATLPPPLSKPKPSTWTAGKIIGVAAFFLFATPIVVLSNLPSSSPPSSSSAQAQTHDDRLRAADNPIGEFPATYAEQGCVRILIKGTRRIENYDASRETCRKLRTETLQSAPDIGRAGLNCVLTTAGTYNRARGKADFEKLDPEVYRDIELACLMFLHNISEEHARRAIARASQ